jgi:hypothetical protein
MSRIMSKLKRLEKSVAPSSNLQTINDIPPRQSPIRKTRWNGYAISLALVAVILVGVVAYVAGIKSGKGGRQRSEKPGKPAITETIAHKSDSGNVQKATMSEIIKEDITTLAFDENENLPDAPSSLTEKSNPAKPEKLNFIGQTISAIDYPAGNAGTGDSKKITALTSAIIKATDNPVTPEEDELNKQTIQKLIVLGIVHDDKGASAIISGKEVREGEKIRQFTVDEIAKDYILLSYKRTLYKKLVR